MSPAPSFARVLVLLIAVALSSTSRIARAEDGKSSDRVLLLVDDPQSPVTARLKAELTGLGLVPVVERASPQSSPTSLDEEAARRGAAAAIRLRRSDRALEIWIADQVTGKTSLRKLSLDAEHDSALTVTKAVELLRASLLEARIEEPPPEPPPPLVAKVLPPPKPAPVLPPSRVVASLDLAPALLLSPGGLGPALTLGLRGGYFPKDYLELQGSLWVPTGSVALVAREGRSAQRFLLGTIGGRGHFIGTDRAVDPTLGVGIGVAWTHGDGAATAPYRGDTAGLVSLFAIAEAGLGVRLTSTLGLRADGGCGAAFPRPVFKFAGREIGRWGLPVCTTSLGLHITFRD